MEQSILNTIKKMLGVDSSYNAFDTDIIVAINTAIFTLTQVGVGPEEGFTISGADETWTDFLGDGAQYEAAKTYIYYKTRLAFDPPTSSSVLDAYNKGAEEYLWRLNVNYENAKEAVS